ncbi:MAG TPA: DUF4386 domain-containing protein [Terriglobales bacterium]|jgi:hypothetical protein|nr:DUF4386 domain-containing protein [Terriglobales bacterium]
MTVAAVLPCPKTLPYPKTRITSVVYLLYFVTVMSATFFMKGLVVSDDAAATANNILAHESLFRTSFAINLIATALYITVTALFYELFRPVNKNLALLAAFFSLVGCAIQAVGYVCFLAPFTLLGAAQYLSVFKLEQLQALVLTFLKLRSQAEQIGLVFFGFFDLLIGCLILRSTFLPRILGALMALAGLGWMMFLSPPLGNNLAHYILPLGFLAEFLLMVWLLVKGVNVQRWQEQASAKGWQ